MERGQENIANTKLKVNVVVDKQWDYWSPTPLYIHVSVPTGPGILTCSSTCIHTHGQTSRCTLRLTAGKIYHVNTSAHD